MISAGTKLMDFSFLVSGPRFELALPDDFSAVPELSSPLSSGFGGRAFNFRPSELDTGIGSDGVVVESHRDAYDRQVDVFELVDPPLTWFLQWPLTLGALYTHLRELDGLSQATVVVNALEIVEEGNPTLPILLPSPPVRSVVSSQPGYHQAATYHSPTRLGWTVTLKRPGFARKGEILLAPGRTGGDDVLLRTGADFGIEVQVTSADDLVGGEDLIELVVDSVSER
jgi:hypothetical protein